MHVQSPAEGGTSQPAGQANAAQGQVLQSHARISAMRSQLLGAGCRPNAWARDGGSQL
jgi:hypothetical protein